MRLELHEYCSQLSCQELTCARYQIEVNSFATGVADSDAR